MSGLSANQAAYDLADRIADLLPGATLNCAAVALTVNLANVVAGYGPGMRETVQEQIHTLLRARVQQLVDAGVETTARIN